MKHLKRLKELREENNLTKKDAAKLLGVTSQTYRGYEIGIHKTPIRHIYALAEYYNTPLDYILEITDVKTPFRRKK